MLSTVIVLQPIIIENVMPNPSPQGLFSHIINRSRMSVVFQFLVHLKIMDYSLLVGIHDVQRVELEEEEEVANEEEVELENGLGMVSSMGSYGNSPDGIGGYLNAHKPLGPGEFDPYIDVYAIKSAQGTCRPFSLYQHNELVRERRVCGSLACNMNLSSENT